MKILICGNGNLTKIGDELFFHSSVGYFLKKCVSYGMTVGYANVVLDMNAEDVKNLADFKVPESIQLEAFESFSRLSWWKKILAGPGIILRIFSLMLRYDFFYCFYPGSLAGIVIKALRLFHRKYALYVRGELKNSRAIRKDIAGASFIFATGCSIVEAVCPDYTKCYEVAPMSDVFCREPVSEPRSCFHSVLRGLFVGRVSREKGIYELLDAMKVLQDKAVPVTMNLVGAYNNDVVERIKELGLENTFFCGLAQSADELQHYYKDADFFCLPTWTEGFPRVLYEAMSYSLPCLSTMVGGIPSRMRNGENCISLEVKNPDSIVDAVLELKNSPDKMKRLAEASLQTFAYWQKFFEGQNHAGQLCAEIKKNIHK